MNEKQQPLVSCIMPTYNRREFVPHAIRYFLRQDYENKELIIIDDGTDTIAHLVPDIAIIRYFRLEQKITLGAKLNMACRYAKGEIIANWDDDDWYAARRLNYQVDALRNGNIDVCGINNLLYYDLRNNHGYKYIYPPDQRTWLLGSSLCYLKIFWSKNIFADINIGMDGLFVWQTSKDRVKVLADSTIAVHMIHDTNVSPKKTEGGWWHTYPVDEIKNIIQADWNCYHNYGSIPVKQNIHLKENPKFNTSTKQPVQLQNVYACLVHENQDCVMDLVYNLHYHDPASIILLYNGGENLNLIQDHTVLKKFGAVIHPRPTPVKHGYLHSFAIDCMQFAIDNFSFNTLTIVDSDQLGIRSGYTDYLTKYLSAKCSIGMFSNMPARVHPDNKFNHVALQAFKEYDLWKPFLSNFIDGESKFVHWTFWPSTVFVSDAVRELVKLFKENRMLQEIMKRTKIWASEEVILPTLVRLLGYEIISNPFSYDFVQYKKYYTTHDIESAFNKPDVYWVHPVERKYNDPVRKYIRNKFNRYSVENKEMAESYPAKKEIPKSYSYPDRFFTLSLIDKIKKIEGWLGDQEADLLISTTLKACQALTPPHNIVEIGSYHGKSTVLFGCIIKASFPAARVYAIDTHDGKLGAADQGLQTFPASLEMFIKNIETMGLTDVVEIIINNSYNVEWQKPVSLLFIDGLHDYNNVSRDFYHFSDHLRPNGYVAFHDYAAYFPGVQTFVNELISTGQYYNVGKAQTLIILQKK